MKQFTQTAETLAAVHTHTHTHTCSFKSDVNSNIKFTFINHGKKGELFYLLE